MELRPPRSDLEETASRTLFSKAFSDYWKWEDFCVDGYFEGAPYDREASRVAVDGPRVVAHFGVWDFSMRIGTAVARTAGIGAVATDRDYRNQGLMTRTAGASVDALRPCGYDLSLLFGIRKFYRRFGYVGTFVERVFGLSTRELTPLSPPPEITPFEGDYRDFAKQYNDEHAGVTGTCVRPTYTKNSWPKKWHGYTFGRGYVVAGAEGDVLSVVDCAGPPEMIVDVVRQLAVGELARKIEFVFVPPRSPLGEFLQTISHTTRTAFVADGGPMIKVVNLPSLLRKLAPELTRRLSSSPMSDYSGRIVISGDADTVEVSISRGEVTGTAPVAPESADAAECALIGGEGLGRLVIGDDDPDRIRRQAGMTFRGEAVHLVPILFPDQEPSTVLWDRF